MSCSTTLEEAILSFVSTSKVSKKEIQMHIKSSRTDEWNKKDVKRALKQLVSDGKLCIESDLYVVPSTGNSSSESSSSEEESGSESDDGSEEQRSFVPIAQRMRKQSFDKVVVGANTNKSESQKVDIDEEIRRLEAELAAADSESDDEQSSGDSESDVSANNKRKISFGKNVTRTFTKDEDSVSIASDNRMDSSGVICLSESASERIEPLPASAMPQIARKAASDEKKSNKRKRNKEEHTVNAGLKSAVEDLLSNYKTRSEVEQTPWYCRVCQHQAEGESDFLAHRASEFHKTAMKEHQKKNYCRMCRKQMTSVVQFQEHLQSRPHRDMLAGKRAQQQARGRGDGRGHRSGAGRGRGCVSRGGGSSKRQWC